MKKIAIKIFILRIVLGSALLLIGIFAGYYLDRYKNDGQLISELRQSTYDQNGAAKNYKFIDPLLACNAPSKKEIVEFNALKTRIDSLIADKTSQNKASQVSVYFDTRDGRWLSINPTEKYSPASLMKVPTAIAVFKEAESQPDILTKKITYDGSFDYDQNEYFKPAELLTANQAYTAEELLRRMLVDSDNNAYFLLSKNTKADILNEIYSDLGITLPANEIEGTKDFLTVKQYANFFRILYNASYLNWPLSEKALNLLSNANFSEGLLAGVPQGLVVAHKFGERSFAGTDSASQKELHDCGIVYYPNHPYLLCVMTKGNNFSDLAGVIGSISGTVYQFIDTEYKK